MNRYEGVIKLDADRADPGQGRMLLDGVNVLKLKGDTGLSGADAVVTKDNGVLTVRTKQLQAMADNETAILELGRRMAKGDSSLPGMYIKACVTGHQELDYEGEIYSTDIGMLTYGLHPMDPIELRCVSLMVSDLVIVVAPGPDAAEKLLTERKAAIEGND